MMPKRFTEREEVSAVRAEAEKAEPGDSLDQEHRVAGRVMARREMGKLTFLDLVDRSARIQLIAREKVDVDLGDVVGVSGKPGRRSAVSRRSRSPASSCSRRSDGRCLTP